MAELWLALLPILLAMLISPARTIAVILLLHTPKGARTAFAYVSGMVTSMMVQGIIFGFLLSVVGLAGDQREGDLAIVVSVLFVVVGIIMLVGGSKFIFQEEDDDQAPPKWLEHLNLGGQWLPRGRHGCWRIRIDVWIQAAARTHRWRPQNLARREPHCQKRRSRRSKTVRLQRCPNRGSGEK